ncbi:hypothetical protein KUCAC02_034797, partial [Chaenocephalus aceratus]
TNGYNVINTGLYAGLQETVKRKLESAGSPGNGFSDGFPPNKKACLENTGSPLDSKLGLSDVLNANGNHGNNNTDPRDPTDFHHLNLNEQEWTELMEELNCSVAYEDIQDILNDGFEDRKDPLEIGGGASLLPPDLVNVKTEFSPSSVAFEQDSRTQWPPMAPPSQSPLGGAFGLDKPSSPSLYQQDFNPGAQKQLLMPQPNKGPQKAGYMSGPQNMMGHQVSGSPLGHPAPPGAQVTAAMLNYSNTKPLSHFEAAPGPPRPQSTQKPLLPEPLLPEPSSQSPSSQSPSSQSPSSQSPSSQSPSSQSPSSQSPSSQSPSSQSPSSQSPSSQSPSSQSPSSQSPSSQSPSSQSPSSQSPSSQSPSSQSPSSQSPSSQSPSSQ